MADQTAGTQRPAAYSGLDCLYIDGRWRAGAGEPLANRDPYTGETLLEIPQATVEDVDAAYRAAARAQPAWAARLPAERAAVMAGVVAVLEARRDEIVDWLVHEAGSTRLKARLEWAAVHAVFQEATATPHLGAGAILPNDVPGKESRVYRKPVGVVGVISPWNWPFQLSARSVAPALAVGNAVVLKPASDTPLTGGILFGKLLEEAGLPPGVLNVVIGGGSTIGDAMVSHAIPRVISFTGSTPVGRGVGRLAADAPIIKRVELELGGNSPLVVLADADLDRAVDAAVWGKFLHQGQICMITNRIIVEAPAFDDFAGRYVERVRQLRVGDPNDPATFVGPVINQRQLDGLVERIANARADGHTPAVGGDPEGLVLPPHVYVDVPADDRLVTSEIFGPIAPIIRARDEDDALRIANDTEYGLSSAVFTRDVDRGVRFARRIEAGMAHVNDQPVNDLPFNPFGGEKNSGLGRFNGRWAVDAFTTEQWVTVQHERRPYPFDVATVDRMGGKPSVGG